MRPVRVMSKLELQFSLPAVLSNPDQIMEGIAMRGMLLVIALSTSIGSTLADDDSRMHDRRDRQTKIGMTVARASAAPRRRAGVEGASR